MRHTGRSWPPGIDPELDLALITMQTQTFSDSSSGEVPVRGTLYFAETGQDFLVLTHGASGNSRAALLIALAEEFSRRHINVLLCDLPYRQRKPGGPPSPGDAKNDQQGLRRAVALMRERFQGRAFLGGSSYGGRQASMLAAGEPKLVGGLLLLSYPLHPPGKPQQLRTQHFPDLATPALFVSGTRDTFGSIEELQQAIRLIPAKTRLVAVEGAAHGLNDKKRQPVFTEVVVSAFAEFLL